MKIVRIVLLGLAGLTGAASKLPAQELKLPPEVTPALRSACEQDVRRLCIGENPTVEKVKSCVVRRYVELSSRCKMQIAAAGLNLGR